MNILCHLCLLQSAMAYHNNLQISDENILRLRLWPQTALCIYLLMFIQQPAESWIQYEWNYDSQTHKIFSEKQTVVIKHDFLTFVCLVWGREKFGRGRLSPLNLVRHKYKRGERQVYILICSRKYEKFICDINPHYHRLIYICNIYYIYTNMHDNMHDNRQTYESIIKVIYLLFIDCLKLLDN